MRRRGVGVGAVHRQRAHERKFECAGDALASVHSTHVRAQLALFREHLEAFCQSHAHQIRKDPEFRRHFQRMCTAIGVDALASKKGFWSELLGFGDYYYALAVQILEVGLVTRARLGGLVSLEALLSHLRARASSDTATNISEDDVRRALAKLEVLGSGVRLLEARDGRAMVLTVPLHLSCDTTTLLTAFDSTEDMLESQMLVRRLGWDDTRAGVALAELARQGLVWIDIQKDVKHYYFTSSIDWTE